MPAQERRACIGIGVVADDVADAEELARAPHVDEEEAIVESAEVFGEFVVSHRA